MQCSQQHHKLFNRRGQQYFGPRRPSTTCHKAQGVQPEHIALALLPAHYVMLNRRLLYTAMTRARRSLTIVGRKGAVAMAVRDVGAPPARDTGLTALL